MNIIITKSSQAPVQISFDPEILYEDPYLLCINKPAGLLSIRDGYDPGLPYVSPLLEPRFGKLWIVHRLDRDTSGIFLLARSLESHRALNAAFEGRQVHKTYHAIVNGCPPWTQHQADLPLKIDADRRHRTIVNPADGKLAQTKFRVIKYSDRYSLMEACPLTGYTHQIRAHLLALGFPLLADPLYSSTSHPPAEPAGNQAVISRLALHAYRLEFRHPVTALDMNLTAPYPGDFLNALRTLSLIPGS